LKGKPGQTPRKDEPRKTTKKPPPNPIWLVTRESQGGSCRRTWSGAGKSRRREPEAGRKAAEPRTSGTRPRAVGANGNQTGRKTGEKAWGKPIIRVATIENTARAHKKANRALTRAPHAPGVWPKPAKAGPAQPEGATRGRRIDYGWADSGPGKTGSLSKIHGGTRAPTQPHRQKKENVGNGSKKHLFIGDRPKGKKSDPWPKKQHGMTEERHRSTTRQKTKFGSVKHAKECNK